MLRAAMPETTIDEYGDARATEQEIGANTHLRINRDIHAVPQSQAMHRRSDARLGNRVTPPNALHSI
jgi:hypothetical protein